MTIEAVLRRDYDPARPEGWYATRFSVLRAIAEKALPAGAAEREMAVWLDRNACRIREAAAELLGEEAPEEGPGLGRALQDALRRHFLAEEARRTPSRAGEIAEHAERIDRMLASTRLANRQANRQANYDEVHEDVREG